MGKVYIVLEQYTFECVTDARVSVYETEEKALNAFKLIVERNKKDTWIGEINPKNLIEMMDENTYNAYSDGRASEFETFIAVQEKEIW